MKKKSLILIGGGGHCKSCIDVIEQEGHFTIDGIIDLPEKNGEKILGYPVIGNDNDIVNLISSDNYFLITLGQIKIAQRRKELFEFLKAKGANLPVIISPKAYVSKHANIDEGTIIMHHALVNTSAKIGKNCIINTKALVEHDVEIGNHCHISTGATINGYVQVGSETFIGSGAVTKENIKIEAKSFIKANSIVK